MLSFSVVTLVSLSVVVLAPFSVVILVPFSVVALISTVVKVGPDTMVLVAGKEMKCMNTHHAFGDCTILSTLTLTVHNCLTTTTHGS